MNLKKKLKAFFTMKRRANDGFTLVELIVVIAILAILGGVAVPAYSGYVKKAELAADEALLHEVNLAFASACAINGEDNFNRTDNPALVFEGKSVDSLKNAGTKVNASFEEFFVVEEPTFKQMDVKEIIYKKEIGGFKLAGLVSYNHLSASEKSVNDFNNSIYADENVMTITDLLGNVDGIVNWANGKLSGVLGDGDFLDFYGELTDGITVTGDEETAKLNALVLYTAQQSGDIDKNVMASVFTGTGTVAENTVATKAMQYAVGMAYVREMNAKLKNGEITSSEWSYIDLETDGAYDLVIEKTKPTVDIKNQWNVVTGQGPNQAFLDWFAANGEATMDGYLGAMDAISDNIDNLTDAQKKQLLNNGYSSNGSGGEDDFLTLVQGLLNGTTTP